MRQRFRKLAALGLDKAEKTFNPAIAWCKTSRSFEALVGRIEILLAGLQKAQIDPACRLSRCDFRGACQTLPRIHILARLERRQTKIERRAKFAIICRSDRGNRRTPIATGTKKRNRERDRYSELQLHSRMEALYLTVSASL